MRGTPTFKYKPPKGMYEKDYSLTQHMKWFLGLTDTAEIGGTEWKGSREELLIRKLFHMAIGGDLGAIRMIWERIEGTAGPADNERGQGATPVAIQILDLSSNQGLTARFPGLAIGTKPTLRAVPQEPLEPTGDKPA